MERVRHRLHCHGYHPNQVSTGTQRPVADTQPAADAVTLSHCRFSIAVQPLRIGHVGDFVRIVTDHLQFIVREQRMIWSMNGG